MADKYKALPGLNGAASGTDEVYKDLGSGIYARQVMLASSDPAVTALGAPTDAKATGDANGSAIAHLRGIATSLGAGLPAALATPADALAALTNLLAVLSEPHLFNGTTWDQQRNNAEFTALASGARTATASSADFTNYNAKGVLLFLNVTVASGAGGLQVSIQGKDPISGGYVTIGTLPTAVIATSLKVYIFYPGATAAQVNTPVPRTWRVQVVAGDNSSYTYSVGACYIL